MMPLMKLRHVSVRRGRKTLFSGLDFTVTAGHITVVLGANGAGKSSLLLAMAGLIPVIGDVELMGKPLQHYPPRERTQLIAWQGELPPTAFGLTVEQRLHLVSNCPQTIRHVASEMAITHLLLHALDQLSSGELQRVELASLMLRDAPVWLLDEPTSHLDFRHQIRLIHTLKHYAARGKAIVVILHDLQQARALADFLILINQQGEARYGACEELFNRQMLCQTFDAPLIEQAVALLPDYGFCLKTGKP